MHRVLVLLALVALVALPTPQAPSTEGAALRAALALYGGHAGDLCGGGADGERCPVCCGVKAAALPAPTHISANALGIARTALRATHASTAWLGFRRRARAPPRAIA